MKFTCTVDVKLPIEKTIALWSDPRNLKEWQDGFISLSHLSGEEGKPGAKSRLLYKMGKREMELIETIQVANLPSEFIALYEHKHMTNLMRNSFTEISPGITRWTSEINYIKFNGFIPRIMSFLMPGMFKKQAQKWFDQFKEFAEKKPA